MFKPIPLFTKAIIAFIFSLLIITVNAQRKWTVTGPEVNAFKGIDSFMKSYMEQYGIYGGSLAIAKDGKMVYARGYTYAEAGYETVQPNSLFRIASLSKPITGLMVHKVMKEYNKTLDTRINDILNLSNSTGSGGRPFPICSTPANKATPGQYFSCITLKNLLQHRGGWNRDANGFNDPTYLHDQDIANVFNNGKLPVTKQQLIHWGAMQQQQFYPDAQTHYSNFGYALLGAAIEKLTGVPYIYAVQQALLSYAGIYRARQSFALSGKRQPGEVKYHLDVEQKQKSVFGPGDVPVQYGAENNDNFDAFGGWLMSSYDYVRLFAAYRNKVYGMPSVSPGNLLTWYYNGKGGLSSKTDMYDHGGLLPGTWSYMAYRMDGVDFMVVWNTTASKENFKWRGNTYSTGSHPTIWHKLLDEVSIWPAALTMKYD